MSRNKHYQRMLNSRRWKELRQAKLNANPLCERCISDGEAAGVKGGFVSAAIDVHHITPVESARSLAEMEQLCFRYTNLQSLCISCHAKTHKELRISKREIHKQRARDDLTRWADRHTRN